MNQNQKPKEKHNVNLVNTRSMMETTIRNASSTPKSPVKPSQKESKSSATSHTPSNRDSGATNPSNRSLSSNEVKSRDISSMYEKRDYYKKPFVKNSRRSTRSKSKEKQEQSSSTTSQPSSRSNKECKAVSPMAVPQYAPEINVNSEEDTFTNVKSLEKDLTPSDHELPPIKKR